MTAQTDDQSASSLAAPARVCSCREQAIHQQQGVRAPGHHWSVTYLAAPGLYQGACLPDKGHLPAAVALHEGVPCSSDLPGCTRMLPGCASA